MARRRPKKRENIVSEAVGGRHFMSAFMSSLEVAAKIKKPETNCLRLLRMMARRQQKNLSWPGPQRTRCQRTRPHAKARSDWRRYRLQGVAAARTKLQARIGAGEMRPQPVPPRGTFLIDALHRPPRQILHRASPSGRGTRTLVRRTPEAVDTADCEAGKPVVSRKNHTRYRGGVAQVWISCETFNNYLSNFHRPASVALLPPT